MAELQHGRWTIRRSLEGKHELALQQGVYWTRVLGDLSPQDLLDLLTLLNPLEESIRQEAIDIEQRERRVDLQDALDRMLKNDPDGGDTEPTEQSYKAFKEWAETHFGKDAYDFYMKGNWGKGPDV